MDDLNDTSVGTVSKKGNHLKSILAALVTVLVLSVAMYPFPIPVEETMQGVALSPSDSNAAETVTLRFSGEYLWKIAGNSSLEMNLKTEGALQEDFILAHSASVLKRGAQNFFPDGTFYEMRGSMRYTPFEKRGELIILYPIVEGKWDVEQGTMLAFPAKTREDALKLLGKYDKDRYNAITTME